MYAKAPTWTLRSQEHPQDGYTSAGQQQQHQKPTFFFVKKELPGTGKLHQCQLHILDKQQAPVFCSRTRITPDLRFIKTRTSSGTPKDLSFYTPGRTQTFDFLYFVQDELETVINSPVIKQLNSVCSNSLVSIHLLLDIGPGLHRGCVSIGRTCSFGCSGFEAVAWTGRLRSAKPLGRKELRWFESGFHGSNFGFSH